MPSSAQAAAPWATPAEALPPQRPRWEGCAVRDGRIEGGFRSADGTGAPVLVELLDGSRVYMRGLSEPDGARHRFALALSALLPAGQTVRLVPRIGGLSLPEAAVTLTAEAIGIVGYVDRADGGALRGWAVDLAMPGRRIAVEARVDGAVVARANADEYRADIAALGLNDGRAAFALHLPALRPGEGEQRVEVVLAGTPTQLCRSPLVRRAAVKPLGCFDAVDGLYATGWLCNLADPAQPLVVEAVCDGRVIGTGRANLYRGDIIEAGLPSAHCGFRVQLAGPLDALLGRDITMRARDTGLPLPGSPQRAVQNPNVGRFLGRADLPEPVLARLRRRMAWQTRGALLSIVMPVYDTRQEWLDEALASVRQQWCPNWELVCVDDGSAAPHVREALEAASRDDPRIRALHLPANGGIPHAVNAGLRAVRGSHVAFMDHDDVLEPDAVHALLTAAKSTGADLLYSDEAVTSEDANDILDVRARPALSYDYYLSHPYFVHLVCVRTDLARRIAGYNESMPVSADVDFVLRALEQAGRVAHVPRVLYRWRTHGGSAGHLRQREVMQATRDALQRHLDRTGAGATVSDGVGFNQFHIDWPDDPGGEILVVIPTRNRADLLRRCVSTVERTSAGLRTRVVVIDHESDDPATLRLLGRLARKHTVMRYTGPFNYAAMNNAAVRAHAGNARYILLLNNDVEAIEPGWMARLRSLVARADVGAAGCLLLYGDRRVQHGGVIVGFRGAADHVAKLVPGYKPGGERTGVRTLGYNSALVSVRDYSAVTAACMMLKRAAWDAVGGFDESFAVGFNDTDLCLRLRAAGYRVLYDGTTTLLHHESATRTERREVAHPEDDARLRARWPEFFTAGDPFYNPLLNQAGMDHQLRSDTGCKGRLRPRVTELSFSTARPAQAAGTGVGAPAARRRRPAVPPLGGASG